MRSRVVKPEFFKHGELYDVEKASGLPIRLAFAGLWGVADRAGRFAWRPRELKLDVLPYDDCDFAEVLVVLERAGFVRSYVVEGKRYGVIPTLKDHQNFHRREAGSRLPPEPEEPEASTNEGQSKDSPRTSPVRAIAGTSPAVTDTVTDTDAVTALRSIPPNGGPKRAKRPRPPRHTPEIPAVSTSPPPEEANGRGGWPAAVAAAFAGKGVRIKPGHAGAMLSTAVGRFTSERVVAAVTYFLENAVRVHDQKPQFVTLAAFAQNPEFWVEQTMPAGTRP